MLPFGLRSAPKIFTAVADALEWCISQHGVDYIFHYLDDFLIMGPPGSSICQENLQKLIDVCSRLGVPLVADKQEGPSPILTFLGIVIDTLQGELRLPPEKLQHLLDMLQAWQSKRVCTRRELESLIGSLQHACKVIRPGRSFMRRAISLLTVAKEPQHHIRLNQEFKADLLWWQTFVIHWNGTAIIIGNGPPDTIITTDASGSWGCGGWQGTKWFQMQWNDKAQDKSIAVKEHIPILIAVLIWGSELRGKHVLSNCDNEAVVSILSSRYSRDQHLMHLLRYLFFIEAHFHFRLSASHVAGVSNMVADNLSRNQLSAFRINFPHADTHPTHIPSSLMQWLLDQDMDWTSPAWTAQFISFVTKA